MSLDTYANLQTAIGNFLTRSDLTAVIPDFITLAEAQMNRRLRVGRMKSHVTTAIATEYTSVPADFMGVVTFDVETSPVRRLKYYGNDDLTQLTTSVGPYAGALQGIPYGYTVVGRQFRFYPPPQQAYTGQLTYWQQIPSLSNAAPSNWLLAAYPDAYLYGALLQSAPYLRADARIPVWASAFGQVMDDIELSDNTESFGARPMSRARNLG